MNTHHRFPGAPPDTPLLTLADVQRWEEELCQKRAQHAALAEEITALERKVAFAHALASERAAVAKQGAETPEGIPTSLPDLDSFLPRPKPNVTKAIEGMIYRVGLRFADGFEPKEIVCLLRNDKSLPPTHKNFPYTVLKRLIVEKILRKDGPKYVLTPKGIEEAKSKAPRDKPEVASSNAGYKVVPLNKQERVRFEARNFLEKHNGGPVHRSAIAAHLVRLGVLGDKDAISRTGQYLCQWREEFVPDGRGNVTLRRGLQEHEGETASDNEDAQ